MALLWSGLAVAAEPMDVVVQEASVLLKNQQGDEALSALQKIPAGSPYLGWAIGEAAKIHYREQHWSKFFGITSYARTQFASSALVDDIRLMEILALLRHCQNDAAIEQVKAGIAQSQIAARPRFEMLASLLEVAATAPDEEPNAEKRESTAGGSIFRGKHLWPVPAKAAQKLDPWKLERKIEPRCDQGGTK